MELDNRANELLDAFLTAYDNYSKKRAEMQVTTAQGVNINVRHLLGKELEIYEQAWWNAAIAFAVYCLYKPL